MTNKDLIENLMQFPLDAEVIKTISDPMMDTITFPMEKDDLFFNKNSQKIYI